MAESTVGSHGYKARLGLYIFSFSRLPLKNGFHWSKFEECKEFTVLKQKAKNVEVRGREHESHFAGS